MSDSEREVQPPQPDDDGLSADAVLAAPSDDVEASQAVEYGEASAEAEVAPSFDVDDTIRGSRTISVSDGSRLVVSFEAFIDWQSGTKVGIKLTSRTVRENPDTKVYPLSTTFRLTLITKKVGNTNPPMEVFPMEDDWPTYGLNLLQANLKWGFYGPGSAFSARSNSVMLPFSGPHLIAGTGEPSDNKIDKVTVWATGGFTSGQKFSTEARSAIRGGA